MLVQLVQETATGDLNQVVYEGPVEEESDRQSRRRVEVRHANSIVDLRGAGMTFWSTGIPEQIGGSEIFSLSDPHASLCPPERECPLRIRNVSIASSIGV